MNQLTLEDYALALRLLAELEGQARQPERFRRACVDAVQAYLPAVSVAFDIGVAQCTSRRGLLELPLSRKVRIRLERRAGVFSGRDRQRLELLRPHLAFLYRQACQRNAQGLLQEDSALLTPRELDVMRWLSCGKTDVDIAQLLQISPRTVQKHLEHIYVKLGVETRTAAVMRVCRLA